LAPGRNLQVSGEVYCQDRRDPLGVVASIVPFNFPFVRLICLLNFIVV
jgi:acyl-CoA reductase-like NAD-dependent aldehyde dehydrogenase